MKLVFLIVTAIAFYLTILLIPVIIRYCKKHEILDYPTDRRIHPDPVPRLGGVGMFISFLIAEIVGMLYFPHLIAGLGRELVGIVLGLFIIFGGGLIDDLYELKPYQKLIFQAAAAAVTIYFGYQVRILTVPFKGTIAIGSWGIPITFLWIIGLINAMNFLDGMDGLAAGVGFIIATTFFISGMIFSTDFPILMACGLMGVTAGFLRYNYPPASIFMGDSGAMMLGYMFAVISVIWPKSLATITMTVPIVALGVPIFETSTTIIRRLITGKSIYKADTKHIFHFLTSSGLSRVKTLWIFYFASVLCSFVVIVILAPYGGLVSGLIAIFILFAFFLLLKLARKLL